MHIIRTLAFFIATAAVAVAAEPQKAVDPDTIKDKVSIALRQEFSFIFNREKDKLLKPTKIQDTDDKKATVRIKLDVTFASPVPVRKGATRPFLEVKNDFEGTLQM